MQECPKCHTQLTAEEIGTGRCPLCGNLLESIQASDSVGSDTGIQDSRLNTIEKDAEPESDRDSTWQPDPAGAADSVSNADSVDGSGDESGGGDKSTWLPDGVDREKIDGTVVVNEPITDENAALRTIADKDAPVQDDSDEDDTWIPEVGGPGGPSASAQATYADGTDDDSIAIDPSAAEEGENATIQIGEQHASEERPGGDSTWLPEDDEGAGKDSTFVFEGSTSGEAQVQEEIRQPGIDSTWIPDKDHDAPPRDTGNATLVVPAGFGVDEPSAGQTVVTSPDDDGDGAQTLITEAGGGDLSPEVRQTMAENWGDGVDAGARPGMTITNKRKGRTPDAPRQSLVIKPRRVNESKAYDPDNDEYELIGKLGEGGMGVVYHARQTSINRDVAIKMLKPKISKSREQQQKFLAEAVVTGDLDHPNIVPIYDVALNNAGSLFYSMKKVQGTPWLDVIKKKSQHENIDILLRTADAVAFAHDRGIVHRDLKPENVMLGSFGEVLVMDWGLAQPTAVFSKSDSIIETTSMGGTPAYMAPEMATGPIDAISFASDIYLLGAILYEIVTERPPHTGKNAMQCLMAAAKNQIVPTDMSGELVDIAMRSMRTNPSERYTTVKEFQGAIREYLAHSESIVMTERANGDLEVAKKTGSYDDFSRAMFAYQEAYELWEGNQKAEEGIRKARLLYAENAFEKGDFDLAAGLLDETDPDHSPVLTKIRAAQREREERQARLKRYRQVGIGLVSVFVITVTIAAMVINKAREKAEIAEGVAKEEQGKALAAAIVARDAEDDAKKERAAAIESEKAAIESEKEAIASEREAQYSAYVARIGLAAAQIKANSFNTARMILEQCEPSKEGDEDFRGWEWGRLSYLCDQSQRPFNSSAKVNAVALSPTHSHFARAGKDGLLEIVPLAEDAADRVQTIDGLAGEVFSVSFDGSGEWLAIGTADPSQYVLLINTQDTRQRITVDGHTEPVLSVRFSSDGGRLLTSGKDNTARLYKLDRQAQQGSGTESISVKESPGSPFRGHTWWVTAAEFSPDESEFVTASQDGFVRIWKTDGTGVSPRFSGHRGAVFAAQFVRVKNEEGDLVQKIVSAGYDRRLLLWSPEEQGEFKFQNLQKGKPVIPEAKYQEMLGHTGTVWSLATNADRTLIVSGAQDNLVKVWNPSTLSAMKTLRGHSSWVRSCLFGNDSQGEWLLSGSYDSTVRQWNINDYEELKVFEGQRFEGHTEAILAARFAVNGSRIVTASADRTARSWAAASREVENEFREGHRYLASSIQFFPDLDVVVTAAVDNTVRAWDIESGTEIWKRTNTGRSAALALSRSANFFVTGGSFDQKRERFPIQIWDVPKSDSSDQTKPRIVRWDHLAEVSAVAISPNEQWIVSGDTAGQLKVWNAKTGELIRTHTNHTKRIQQIQFSKSGRRLFTASSDNSIGQWDFATGRELTSEVLKHPEGVLAMDVSDDAQWLCSTCEDGQLRIWDLQRDQVVKTIRPIGEWDSVSQNLRIALDRKFPKKLNGESGWTDEGFAKLVGLSTDDVRAFLRGDSDVLGPVASQTEALRKISNELKTPAGIPPNLQLARLNSVTCAPDFSRVASVNTADLILEIWDPRGDSRRPVAMSDFRKTGGLVWKAAFLRSHKTAKSQIVTVGGDEARIIAASDAKVLAQLNPHATVSSASFSNNGELVLTAGWDSSVRIWEASTGTSVRRLFGVHEGAINSAYFSPDDESEFVLTAGSDGQVVLWDRKSAKSIRTYEGHTDIVNEAVFSDDRKLVVTACDDGFCRVFDRESGELRYELDHRAPEGEEKEANVQLVDVDVLCVAISPDSRAIVTGSSDTRARYWLIEGDSQRRTLPRLYLDGHTAPVNAVAFSPKSGHRIVTGSDDYTAKIWDIPRSAEPTDPDAPEEDAEAEMEHADDSDAEIAIANDETEEEEEEDTAINAILSLSGHSREVTSVVFSPDGLQVLTSSRDGTAILWPAMRWDGQSAKESQPPAVPPIAVLR